MGVLDDLRQGFLRLRKPHLRFRSPGEWARSLPIPLLKITNHDEQERRFRELEELKQHLWGAHLATLSPDEQAAFHAGTHPSLSHRFSQQAEPIADEFASSLLSAGIEARVGIGAYHGDRLVLTADLSVAPGAHEDRLPWLFRGFEVKYTWPRGMNES